MKPLGSYEEVATLLNLSRQTVYGMTSTKKFPLNVYLGHGRFNMDKLEQHIEAGTLFRPAQWSPREQKAINYKDQIKQVREAMVA